MFGNKKSTFPEQQVETIIGKDTQFKGNLNASSGVRIDGDFEGDVNSSGDVIIGETGKLTAQIKARNAVIAGEVHGNVEVQERLELMPAAKLFGDIKVGVLIIGEGAVFKGACTMRNE